MLMMENSWGVSAEEWAHILSYLEVSELLLSAGLLSKTFSKLAKEDFYWHERLRNRSAKLAERVGKLLGRFTQPPPMPPHQHYTNNNNDDSNSSNGVCTLDPPSHAEGFLGGVQSNNELVFSRDEGRSAAADSEILFGTKNRRSNFLHSSHGWMAAYEKDIARRNAWDSAWPQRRTRFKAHDDAINCISLFKTTQFGSLLASCSFDRSVRIWMPYEDAFPLSQPDEQQEEVDSSNKVSIAPCNCGDCQTCLYWTEVNPTLRPRIILQGHEDTVWSLKWVDKCPLTLASASFDQTVKLWDAQAGQEKWRGDGHSDRVLAVEHSFKSGAVATAGRDGRVLLWDPRAAPGPRGELRPAPRTPCVYSLCWITDHILIAGIQEGLVLAFDNRFNGGLPLWQIQAHPRPVLSLAFSNMHRALVTTSKDCTFLVHTFEQISSSGEGKNADDVDYSQAPRPQANPDSEEGHSTGAFGGGGSNAPPHPTTTVHHHGHRAPVRAALFCGGGGDAPPLLATAGNDWWTKLWGLPTTPPPLPHCRRRHHHPCFSSSGCPPQFRGGHKFHAAQVTSLAGNRDLLASASVDCTINLNWFS